MEKWNVCGMDTWGWKEGPGGHIEIWRAGCGHVSVYIYIYILLCLGHRYGGALGVVETVHGAELHDHVQAVGEH